MRIINGSGDKAVPMENQERTCLFHWTHSLEKHTKANIRPDLQSQDRQLCKQYKDAKTSVEVESRYLAIWSWWLSSGATTEEGLFRLEQWLAFWHFRYHQWGGFMQLVYPLPPPKVFVILYSWFSSFSPQWEWYFSTLVVIVIPSYLAGIICWGTGRNAIV